jgi:hypothetical protein
MGGLLDKPKPVTIAPPKPAPPVPTVDEDVVGTEAKKKRPRGRQETFLTGALVPSGNVGSKLGGGV